MRSWWAYVIAVLGYIALSFLTKRFLTWTWGPFYFIFWLEIVPRTIGRLRHQPPAPSTFTRSPETIEAAEA